MSLYTDAACIGQADLMLSTDRRRDALRRAICAACPVIEACRRQIIETEHHSTDVVGFRAGLTERERRASYGTDRVMNPNRIKLIALMSEQGLSAREIAARLEISDRTVNRYRRAYQDSIAA
jgi:DNA-binding NarL/FixJ family response regulator